jgi:hypothetical protein
MAWVLVGLQMEENSMTQKEMIEAWVKKNKPKRYTHGERPEGQDPEEISPWGRRRKKKSKAEKQAEKDSEKG